MEDVSYIFKAVREANMAYSIDLRTRVMLYIEAGGKQKPASGIFKVAEKTIRNWLRLKKETGTVKCRPHGGGFQSKIDAEEFKEYVKNNPDKTLKEIGDNFGVTYEGVAYNLRKYGYVYKKSPSVRRTQCRKRQEYMDRIKDIKKDDLVYVDESGIDHRIIKDMCWVKKGHEVIGNRSGRRKLRTSIIAALNGRSINAPVHLQGSTTGEVFICWTEHVLVPSLKPGQVVVMDNASFHKSPKIKNLIENAGCSLIYLPPYSPDLNPIENYWAVLKKHIAKTLTNFDTFFDALDNALQNPNRYFHT